MRRNCRSRSVRCCRDPLPLSAIFLRLAWREYPSALSRQATVLSLTMIPSRRNSSAIFLVALRVHFNPVMGSPAVSYLISERMRSMIRGVFFNGASSTPFFANTTDLLIPLKQLTASTGNGVVVDIEQAGNDLVSA